MPASNQRQHILRSAIHLFAAAENPRVVSMAHVAAAAEVSRATLYRYFKDRDALVEAVADATGTPQPRTDPRAQILEAALAVFAEHGIHAATLREIATRAGLSLSGLHWHFKSKEEIVAALAEYLPVLPAMRAAATQPDTEGIESQLAHMAELMLGMLHEHGSLLRLAICEAGVHPDVADLVARYTAGEALRTLAQVIEEHTRRGDVRPGSARLRAQAFMGMMSTLILLRPVLGDLIPAGDGECAREFVRILLYGILAERKET